MPKHIPQVRRVLGPTLAVLGLVSCVSCGAEVLLGIHDGALPDADAEAGGTAEAGDTGMDGGGLDAPDTANECGADLSTSSTSCGACGHGCGGAACKNGLCDPILLANGLDGPLWIDTDGVEVFWGASAGAVEKLKPVQKTSTQQGGFITTLNAGVDGRLGGVHVDGPFVYAAQRPPTTFSLQRLATTDGGATQIGLGTTGQPQAVRSNATTVFVAMGTDVRAFPKTNMSFAGTPIGDPFTESFGLALDGDSLFVSDRMTGTISVIDTTTSAASVIATGQGKLAGLTFDATHVYFTGKDLLGRVPKGGGTADVLATNFGESLGVVVDGPWVYWAANGPPRILAVPKSGGPMRVLFSGLVSAGHLTQDAEFLYFPDFLGGAVYKMAKLPK